MYKVCQYALSSELIQLIEELFDNEPRLFVRDGCTYSEYDDDIDQLQTRVRFNAYLKELKGSNAVIRKSDSCAWVGFNGAHDLFSIMCVGIDDDLFSYRLVKDSGNIYIEVMYD